MDKNKSKKKEVKYIKVSEADYRRAKRDRERLLKLKALVMAMSNMIARID
jgi:hypothetical protein